MTPAAPASNLALVAPEAVSHAGTLARLLVLGAVSDMGLDACVYKAGPRRVVVQLRRAHAWAYEDRVATELRRILPGWRVTVGLSGSLLCSAPDDRRVAVKAGA